MIKKLTALVVEHPFRAIALGESAGLAYYRAKHTSRADVEGLVGSLARCCR